MKAIMIMFDSLNRRLLPPYGCDWIQAPNFKRLASKTVTFDNCYVGSLPCMPARREIHTGRYNFLHRSWGPIEPFDDCMPEILHTNGVYTHLVSDHYHYWEDGGCTYHTRYKSWEIIRGHEGDPWKGEVKDPDIPDHVRSSRENTPHVQIPSGAPTASHFIHYLYVIRRRYGRHQCPDENCSSSRLCTYYRRMALGISAQ